MKRQTQSGWRTSSGKPLCTPPPVKKLVWIHIPHSLASRTKSCARRPTHFLTEQPKCSTCLMRVVLAGYTSDSQSAASNNADKDLIASLYTQAHISSYHCTSLLCERREDMLPQHDDMPFPNSHALLIQPSEGSISSDQERACAGKAPHRATVTHHSHMAGNNRHAAYVMATWRLSRQQWEGSWESKLQGTGYPIFEPVGFSPTTSEGLLRKLQTNVFLWRLKLVPGPQAGCSSFKQRVFMFFCCWCFVLVFFMGQRCRKDANVRRHFARNSLKLWLLVSNIPLAILTHRKLSTCFCWNRAHDILSLIAI